MQLLSAKFSQINAEINATNAQIAALQAKLSELQEFQQQLLSVEQACESACQQVQTALMMLRHVDPSQEVTLKNGIANLFNCEVIGVLEPAAPTNPEPAPEPTAPITPGAPTEPENGFVIEVQAEPEPESEATPVTAPEPVDTHIAESLPSEDDLATQAELEALSIQQIRRLAARKKAGGSGTRTQIATRLAGRVTRDEIWRTA